MWAGGKKVRGPGEGGSTAGVEGHLQGKVRPL